ncbi:hypothetical protein B0T11DRAFT_91908 [Plectosphaerella cucumerina]|uniref:C2H2-type domain-containing protein n=1 Tax=Plectosphaerella cucumerina TaxID=40658 RepID=A0A8K0X5U7_9PEZI|nr:hypothetical protein B0T11DRAFT_91908 [Plectosphaerella cucumerina]
MAMNCTNVCPTRLHFVRRSLFEHRAHRHVLPISSSPSTEHKISLFRFTFSAPCSPQPPACSVESHAPTTRMDRLSLPFLHMSDLSHTRNHTSAPRNVLGPPPIRARRATGRKRPRFEFDEGEEDDGDILNKGAISCPFYKSDVDKHYDCRGFAFTRFSDMLQHIWRWHVRTNPYCALCNRRFGTEKARNSHTQRKECSRVLLPSDFIALDTFEEFKKDNRGPRGDDKTKWYSFFSRFFPNKKAPQSMSVHRDIRDSIWEVSDAAGRFIPQHPDLPIVLRVLGELSALIASPLGRGVSVDATERQHQHQQPQGPFHPPGTLPPAPRPSESTIIPVDHQYPLCNSEWDEGVPAPGPLKQEQRIPMTDEEWAEFLIWPATVNSS